MKKNYFLKKLKISLVLALTLLVSQVSIAQTTHNISDPEDLSDLTDLVPGDVVILADGTYSTDERIIFSGTGTADAPITFRAATPGGVLFDNGMPMSIAGDYLVVDGFHWKGGYGQSNFIQFRNGYVFANHSTIQNCVIDGLEIDPEELLEGLEPEDEDDSPAIVKHRWIVLYGTYNTIINCSLMNKKSAGAMVLAEYEYNAWGPPYNEPEDDEPDNGYQTINTRCEVVGHTISNNYFYNFEKMDDVYAEWGGDDLSNAGDSETIRIGTSEFQNVNSNVTVSNNYFVKADGENEIITNKSKGNTYSNNTFKECRGSLVLRHGSHATVDGNYFLGGNVEGTGGIRITDSYHVITNNYIQDCVATVDQAKWNNGITFMGGGDSSDVDCSSTSVSNGYQKTTDIDVSNNTIMNTYSPLYFNTDKGSTDPSGDVDNNLIYFTAENANITAVIMGEYASIGTALGYEGNVYNGTTLGVTNTGFTEDTGIEATKVGDIYTFEGTDGKGADMSSYTLKDDAMVGYGIGACFVDNLGASIDDGDCSAPVIPEPGDYLTLGNLQTFSSASGEAEVALTSNVTWSLVNNNSDWITITVDGVFTTSGSGDATITVEVTENADSVNGREGTVTFTGIGDDGSIEKILTVNQEKAEATAGLNLINVGENGAPVTIDSFSKEQGPDHPDPKTNYATNSLDKEDETYWVADDLEGDGEYIIYNLNGAYALDMIEISTNSKSDAYGFQIWVSTTGTDAADFTKLLPATDYLFTNVSSTEFNQWALNGEKATYVKIIGFGRFSDTTNGAEVNNSKWSTIDEVNFYGESTTLAIEDFDFNRNVLVYPIPAKNTLNIKMLEDKGINNVKIFSIDGRLVIEKQIEYSNSALPINVEGLATGSYILNLSGTEGNVSKMILITD